jgi:hypothetical protein
MDNILISQTHEVVPFGGKIDISLQMINQLLEKCVKILRLHMVVIFAVGNNCFGVSYGIFLVASATQDQQMLQKDLQFDK